MCLKKKKEGKFESFKNHVNLEKFGIKDELPKVETNNKIKSGKQKRFRK